MARTDRSPGCAQRSGSGGLVGEPHVDRSAREPPARCGQRGHGSRMDTEGKGSECLGPTMLILGMYLNCFSQCKIYKMRKMTLLCKVVGGNKQSRVGRIISALCLGHGGNFTYRERGMRGRGQGCTKTARKSMKTMGGVPKS